MTCAEFVALVRAMRAAQKRYFSSRSQDALAHSKVLEQKTDRAVKEFERGVDLFDGEGRADE